MDYGGLGVRRLRNWVLQGAMGATTARQVSAFRAFQAPLRQAFADYNGPFVCLDVAAHLGRAAICRRYHRHDEPLPGTIELHPWQPAYACPEHDHRLQPFCRCGWPVGPVPCVFARLACSPTCWGATCCREPACPALPFCMCDRDLFRCPNCLALGIIGEYLATHVFRMMERPSYIVRQRTGGEGSHVCC